MISSKVPSKFTFEPHVGQNQRAIQSFAHTFSFLFLPFLFSLSLPISHACLFIFPSPAFSLCLVFSLLLHLSNSFSSSTSFFFFLFILCFSLFLSFFSFVQSQICCICVDFILDKVRYVTRKEKLQYYPTKSYSKNTNKPTVNHNNHHLPKMAKERSPQLIGDREKKKGFTNKRNFSNLPCYNHNNIGQGP